ncbi:MAG: FliM/FliN family flagellar motor switch protein [Pseudomonadota bacterium]
MTSANNVLTRKVADSRVSRSPVAQLDLVGDVFTKILDEELWRILRHLTSTKVITCEVRKLSEFLDKVASPTMLAIIDVAGCKDRQLINVSSGLVNMIVDLRLGGDPSRTNPTTVRAITEIDMTLCEDFIERVLHAFSRAMAMALEATDIPKLSLLEYEQYSSLVSIAPDNADVLVIKATIETQADPKGAEFDFVIPLSALDTFKSATKNSALIEMSDTSADLWHDHMKQVASLSAAHMNAVLHSFTMEAQDLEELTAGQVIALPRQCLTSVDLVIEGTSAQSPLATGRLGNLEGQKAVRLTVPPDVGLQGVVAASLNGEAAAE